MSQKAHRPQLLTIGRLLNLQKPSFLGCQFVKGCRGFSVTQLAGSLDFWLNSTGWSDERHNGGGF